MAERPKLAMYWGASCGGCEISLVNLHGRLLEVAEQLDFFFCPCLLDTKKRDIEALADKSIAITFFNGAIRTAENEEMACLLRRKSETLIAFGSCARGGCIPALSNLHGRDDHFRSIYLDNPTIDNKSGILPQQETVLREGSRRLPELFREESFQSVETILDSYSLHLPEFFPRVKSLAQTVQVDYYIPGCPPEPHRIADVIDLVLSGAPLPAKGSVLGAGPLTLCDECRRTKTEKKLQRLYRTHEIIPDREQCLLEQGLVCMGIATRQGCGALCPEANMPCTGCYGPPDGVSDQGAAMVAALGAIMDIGDLKGVPEGEITARIEAVVGAIPDLAGTFYKYSLADSLLGNRGRR